MYLHVGGIQLNSAICGSYMLAVPLKGRRYKWLGVFERLQCREDRHNILEGSLIQKAFFEKPCQCMEHQENLLRIEWGKAGTLLVSER